MDAAARQGMAGSALILAFGVPLVVFYL